jgi:WD40 repeat protein
MDTPLYRRVNTLRLPGEGPVYAVDFHPNGTEFAVAKADAVMRFRASDGNLIDTPSNERSFGARYSPDGRWLVSKANHSHLMICDLTKDSQYDWKHDEDPRLTFYIEAYSFADPDHLLLPGNPVQMWALAEQRLMWKVTTQRVFTRPFGSAAAARADGEQVAIYGVEPNAVTLHDGLTGALIGTLPECPDGVMRMAYVGHYLIVQATKKLRLYDTRTQLVVRAGQFAEPYGRHIYYSLRVHPTQPLIAVGNTGGLLSLFNIPEGELLMMELIHNSRIHDMAFSPDGQRLLVTCEDESRIDMLERAES